MRRIDPFDIKLNEATAYWMARFSKLAYVCKDDGSPNQDAILAELKAEDPEIEGIVPFHAKGSSAILIEHANYFALAFRGTDEPRDWIDNINTIPTASLFGRFHRGFYNSLERIWPEITNYYQKKRTELRKLENKAKGFFLTGHSLGGAMATVAASQLIYRDYPFTSVYTFGQPRAVTAETADILNIRARNRYYRFQNNNDVVTRMPARMMGYSHVGTYMHILQDKTIVNDPGLWLQFLDMKDGIIDDIRDKDFATFEDHMMEDYLFAINQWDLRKN
jgi:triacylglycerol lipase